MVTFDKRAYLKAMIEDAADFNTFPIESLIEMGNFFGRNPFYFRGVYKAFRTLLPFYENKPMIGSKFRVFFDYKGDKVSYEQLEVKLYLSVSQFLLLMGLVDAVYSEILPLGTIVELDTELLPDFMREMFNQPKELGALVHITGRKQPMLRHFKNYIVDYTGTLWPFGKDKRTGELAVSTLMIKRVVQRGYTNEIEEAYAFDFLRLNQLSQRQLSSAFMPLSDALAFSALQRKEGTWALSSI